MENTVRRASASRERGFVLVATAATAVMLLGFVGLAFDIGRMYVARSEAQAYTDSAAIAAALELDGTSAGISRAINKVAQTVMKWNVDSTAFPTPSVDFATAVEGPWLANPIPAANYTHARVRTTVSLPLYFLPAVVGRRLGTVAGSSVAAQVLKFGFKEGIFPFSPFAHNMTPPNFGLIPGQDYTLRWATTPKLSTGNVCPGDQQQSMIDIANAQGGSDRGFIEDSSAASIRATIEDDYQTVSRQIGDVVQMTGGAKQTELTSLQVRINQDSDRTSPDFATYINNGLGNGRRIVVAPINDGGTPPGTNDRIVQFAAFFLHPTGEYGNGGNQAWCAEYIGAWVQGSSHQGAGAPGAYVVRLVQ